jgi:hypothetical protein
MRTPEGIPISSGSHGPGQGFNVGELCAWLEGSEWTGRPKTVCPVIMAYVGHWSDYLASDADRERLIKPFITRMVGSNKPAAEATRKEMVRRWWDEVYTPAVLELTGTIKPDAKWLPKYNAVAKSAAARIETFGNEADRGIEAELVRAVALDYFDRSVKRDETKSKKLEPMIANLQASATELVGNLLEL